MRWLQLVGGAILATTVTSAAPKTVKKKADPWLDVPRMASAGSPTEQSVITVDCALVTGTTPRRAQCTMTQAMVIGPLSASRLSERNAELDQLAKAKGPLAKHMRASCTKKVIAEVAARATLPEEQTYVGKYKDACATKDAVKLVNALRWHLTNVEAHQCDLEAIGYQEEFTQQDANTWTTTKAGLLCNTTTVMTLWRKPGDSLWNYKQVRSVPPNADPTLCSGLSQTPTEWRWDATRTRCLGCKFFSF